MSDENQSDGIAILIGLSMMVALQEMEF